MRSKLLDREEFDSHYEYRTRRAERARGVLPAAGIFLLDGRLHVAELHAAAERALRAAGALLVVGLRFDGSLSAAVSGGLAGALDPGELVAVESAALALRVQAAASAS